VRQLGWIQQACLDLLDAQGGVIEDWSELRWKLTILGMSSLNLLFTGQDTLPELVKLGWNSPPKETYDLIDNFFEEYEKYGGSKPAEYYYKDEPRYVSRQVPNHTTFNDTWFSLERKGLVKCRWDGIPGGCVDNPNGAYCSPTRIQRLNLIDSTAEEVTDGTTTHSNFR